MVTTQEPLSRINLRRHRKRRIATALKSFHDAHKSPPLQQQHQRRADGGIKIVCISDTHKKRPPIPDGDVLIHAGDLTENDSFEEVQNELHWLSSQPHRYKLFVAGNHDVLLDEAFLEKYPERRYGQVKTNQDLDWGSVIYLQDRCVTLEFPKEESVSKKLIVFGSPWTPQYGISAFQYRPEDGGKHWQKRFAALEKNETPDVLVTHGPPRYHLDKRDFYRAGCPFLAEQVSRLKPRLVVCGHIHAAFGREVVVLDGVQRV
jgi:Icc-related predicted phosphoesterase